MKLHLRKFSLPAQNSLVRHSWHGVKIEDPKLCTPSAGVIDHTSSIAGPMGECNQIGQLHRS